MDERTTGSFRWPFDWKTPFGYLVAWLAQCVGIGTVDIAVVSFFNIIIGSNWLFIVMAKDITNDAATFNSSMQLVSHARLMQQFLDVVKIYLDAKQ